MQSITKTIIVISATLLLTSCATYTYTDAPPTLGGLYSKYLTIGYPGEIKPINEVGVITTDGLILVHSVDGKPVSTFRRMKSGGLYSGGRYQLHLLPGSHTLTMGFHDDRGGPSKSWSTSDVTKVIELKAGSVVHLSKWEGGYRWGANITDGEAALPTITADFDSLRSRPPAD